MPEFVESGRPSSSLGKRKLRESPSQSAPITLQSSHLSRAPSPASESESDPDSDYNSILTVTDETEEEDDTSSDGVHSSKHQSHLKVASGSQQKPQRPRKYICSHEGCPKAYTKPSRLTEHERSHTGQVGADQPYRFSRLSDVLLCVIQQRPFSCVACRKSYLRETHLQAHARTHLPECDKPFVCTSTANNATCGKRFWTKQHLLAHAKRVHEGLRPYHVSAYCFDCFSGPNLIRLLV